MHISRRRVVAGATCSLSASFAPPAYCTTKNATRNVIDVYASKGATTGILSFYGHQYPCALGHTGLVRDKREGDGGTPTGTYSLREVRYRPDRMPRPKSRLPVFQIRPFDGWCDDPRDPEYNRPVRLPFRSDAEKLWREDHLYDVIVVIGYNDSPAVPNAGSAIFLHVSRTIGTTQTPTNGCISMQIENIIAVIEVCGPGTLIKIQAADEGVSHSARKTK